MNGPIPALFLLRALSVKQWLRLFSPRPCLKNSAATRWTKRCGTITAISSSFGTFDTIKLMIRQIVLFGEDVLDKPAETVTNLTDEEVKLVQDMVETMYKAP